MTRKLETKAQDWAAFKYVVFDVPNSQAPYRERYAQLGKYLIGFYQNLQCNSMPSRAP